MAVNLPSRLGLIPEKNFGGIPKIIDNYQKNT